MREQIQDYLDSGVISTAPVAPPCISRLTTTKRADGRLRLIADLRPLNQFVAAPKFKSEDIRTALTMVNPGDFMTSIDLKDGFLHIPVHPSHRQYLGFTWQGDYYQFNALPFGLLASPFLFGKVVREVTTMLRHAGIPVMAYVDDFLITGSSVEECARHTHQVVTLLQALGWSINYKKSHLEPSQIREYLGFIIDSTGSAVHLKVPAPKVHSIRHDIARLQRKAHAGTVSARALASLLGRLVATMRAVLPAKLLLRNLYRDLHSVPSFEAYLTLSATPWLTWIGGLMP